MVGRMGPLIDADSGQACDGAITVMDSHTVKLMLLALDITITPGMSDYPAAANAIFGGGNKRVVKANEALTFEARESETLAIVGESGCDKSTFAKVLMGLETATEGEILLDGRNIEGIPIEKHDTKTVPEI